ncbi:hypothetical protein BsWGS_16990 [Bradybaena similaris]
MAAKDMAARKGWVQVMPAVGDVKLKPVTRETETGRDPQQPKKALLPPGPAPPNPFGVPPTPPPRIRKNQPNVSAPELEEGYVPTLHRDAMGGSGEDPYNIPCHDFYFDSEKVIGLNTENFTTVLTRKDATLVMFYSEKNPESREFQKTFSEAACNTKRENHAFAGVDCELNPTLCKANGVCTLPAIRLYSKSYCIGELKCVNTLSAEVLRQYVEMAPVADESRMVACRAINN